ncbi:MAG: 3-oxoacyl-ACP reductase FabG [Chloroflexi bacterium]|nr:3-oxoacyl-ACP reductase FabG [Chloroflexota bacterium]
MSILSSFSLEGKKALVTGGKRGLGKAIALGFAEAGADVAICSRMLADGELEATADEIRKLGRCSLAIQADVTRKSDVENMVREVVDEFGAIDILVNNAGQYIEIPTLELSEEDWRQVHDTHLKGSFLCSQTAGKVMVKQKRGNIINIASLAGIRPIVSPGGYDAAKAGLMMFTTSLAIELASYNIRVNAIAPGFTKTKMNERITSKPEILKKFEAAIALGRLGEPVEIATVAVFLASNASSYVTGITILVDGGFHPQWPIRL